jgi:hypothetical protein
MRAPVTMSWDEPAIRAVGGQLKAAYLTAGILDWPTLVGPQLTSDHSISQPQTCR